jgi:LAO/AO transport system kinase
MDPLSLANSVSRRERASIGRALSFVEDRRPAAMAQVAAFLRALSAASPGSALRVGFTGPPGVGKSSILSSLSRHLRASERTVGVLAVDPSSPRSGGALLGDRARIDSGGLDDPGIFIRSMASGGDLGGLARAAYSAVEVLSACHDVVLIETVGVGQSETDVELVADVTVLVMQPDSGDTLQFLKAGILEIPDLIVLNKADLGNAPRARQELAGTLKVAQASGTMPRMPQVVMATASQPGGVEELLGAIEQAHAGLLADGGVARRRRAGMVAWCQRTLARRVGELGVERLGGRKEIADVIGRGIDEGMHGLEMVASLEGKLAMLWKTG